MLLSGVLLTDRGCFSVQACCLCMLRGGALKPTTDGHWAHLVCALTIPEVMFEDVTRRGPINVDKVPAARKKLVSGGQRCL